MSEILQTDVGYQDPDQAPLVPQDVDWHKWPHRGHLRTLAAKQWTRGVSIHCPITIPFDEERVFAHLKASGFRALRWEISWPNVDFQTQLLDDRELLPVVQACRTTGMGLLVLLNADPGKPCPVKELSKTVVSGGLVGTRTVVLNNVTQLVEDYCGLDGQFPGAIGDPIIVDITGTTVTFSKDLPNTLSGSEDFTRFAFRPFARPDTAPGLETQTGFMDYVDQVLAVVGDNIGDAEWDVELNNEGGRFFNIANYYAVGEAPPEAHATNDEADEPGGARYELGALVADRVHAIRPASRIIWGFTNLGWATDLRAADLPPGVDGLSNHPYHHEATMPPMPESAALYPFVPPHTEFFFPEGTLSLDLHTTRLDRFLHPDVDKGGNRTVFTEHGVAPQAGGVVDEDEAYDMKRKSLLRNLIYWPHQGVDELYFSSAWKSNALQNGLLPVDLTGDLDTPPLLALRRLMDWMEDSEEIAEPTTQRVELVEVADRSADRVSAGARPLYQRDRIFVGPFQHSARRYTFATYIFDINMLTPARPMLMRIGMPDIDPGSAFGYYDPVEDVWLPIKYQFADGFPWVKVQVVDHPRLIKVVQPLPPTVRE